MHRLTNPIRNYAWGSRTHIPKLCGLPVTDAPVAEMWFGAHPADPSVIESGERLDRVITRSPEHMLGKRVVDAFGPRLPFMMKLLAAAEPLSLQVHPTSERARIRCAEQDAAGIALTAPERSYPDPSHKPELIYALTRFEGMAGFRDVHKTAAILHMLEIPWLTQIADELDATTTPFQTLRGVVTDLLALTGPDLEARLVTLGEAAADAEHRSHHPEARRRPPHVDAGSVRRESVRVFEQTRLLVERYPSDPGVLVTLLLNHVVLAAGEALYIAPGTIHAYTSGFGVEIMASSDNVLRAGLTPKFVDRRELLEVANFNPMPPPRWEGIRGFGQARDVVTFAPPVDEFQLAVEQLDGSTTSALPQDSPVIVICIAGEARVGRDALALGPGQAVFVEPGGQEALTGTGTVAVGRTGAHLGKHRDPHGSLP